VPRGESRPLADAIIFALQEPDQMRVRVHALPALAEEFALERIASALVALLQGDPDQPDPSSRA